MVKVNCYGDEMFYESAEEAISKYEEMADGAETFEQTRYLNILHDLDEGKSYASDMDGNDMGYDYDEIMDEHDIDSCFAMQI